MIYPDKAKFRKLSEKYSHVTIYREIVGDTLTPIGLLKNFSNRDNLFLLESANLDKTFSRFSFFGINPSEIVSLKNGSLNIEKNGKKTKIDINPVDYLNSKIEKFNGYADPMFGAFSGGYVGYFGYEFINYTGTLRQKLTEPADENLIYLMLMNEFYVFDNRTGRVYAACNAEINGNLEENYETALKRTRKMADEINDFNFDNYTSSDKLNVSKEFSKEEFEKTVNKLKSDIADGELIQCVFSNKYEVKGNIHPLSFYRSLRNVNPSPYMFYFKMKDKTMLGSSPEIHLKVENCKATLKPIAGTYPVGEDIEKIKTDLLEDEKEKSEHLMLLDLARNDLYTSCDTGSVKVEKSFNAEVYSHVVHIVSEVSGRLRDDKTSLDAFVSTFPAGTVSGAPKIRAMEIISECERSHRGFYAGCAGYISYNGNLDTCITIRSAMVKPDKTIIRAGAGIVYDSVPEKEYHEVEGKLKALFTAIDRIKNLEGENVFAN